MTLLCGATLTAPGWVVWESGVARWLQKWLQKWYSTVQQASGCPSEVHGRLTGPPLCVMTSWLACGAHNATMDPPALPVHHDLPSPSAAPAPAVAMEEANCAAIAAAAAGSLARPPGLVSSASWMDPADDDPVTIAREWYTRLNVEEPAVATLQELHHMLHDHSSTAWVQPFVLLHGVDALCIWLQRLHARAILRPQRSAPWEAVEWLLLCLWALMNAESGMRAMLALDGAGLLALGDSVQADPKACNLFFLARCIEIAEPRLRGLLGQPIEKLRDAILPQRVRAPAVESQRVQCVSIKLLTSAAVRQAKLTLLIRRSLPMTAGTLSNRPTRLKGTSALWPHSRPTAAPGTFPVPSLYLPCTFPVPSLYLPCTFTALSSDSGARYASPLHLPCISPASPLHLS